MAPPVLDLAHYTPVNTLWPQLLSRLGPERGARAVRQALDLQAMQGSAATLPLLLTDTAGIALLSAEQLRRQTGLAGVGEQLVLLVSSSQRSLQLLQHS